MRALEISTLAFRLAALYVWFQTIRQAVYLPTILSIGEGELARASWIGFTITPGLHAVLGTALWFAGPSLARRTLGVPTSEGMPHAAAIGGLALRLSGIWLIDSALQRVWNVVFQIEFSSAVEDWSRLRAESTVLGIYAVLGVVLLAGGWRLAARMFRSSVPQRPLASEVQRVAFSVLGLVIVVRALPAVLSGFKAFEGWIDPGSVVSDPDGAPWPVVVVTLVRLGIGAFLFLGSGALSRAWHWAQTAGLDRDRDAAPTPRP